jgi:hypothetical protein
LKVGADAVPVDDIDSERKVGFFQQVFQGLLWLREPKTYS